MNLTSVKFDGCSRQANVRSRSNSFNDALGNDIPGINLGISYDQLRNQRFTIAKAMQSQSELPRNLKLVKKAIDLNSARLKTTNNQDVKARLHRRHQNLEFIQRYLSQNSQSSFYGFMGWDPSVCDHVTRHGDGSSQIDSIFIKFGDTIKCIQLDSCLEAQQLRWVDTSQKSQNLDDHGRLYHANDKTWANPDQICCRYKNSEIKVTSLIDESRALQSNLRLSGNHSTNALTAFQFKLNQFSCAFSDNEQIKDWLNVIKDEFRPENNPVHSKKIEVALNTPTRVRSGGLSWALHGDGSVNIGKAYGQNGDAAIDVWVDNMFGVNTSLLEKQDAMQYMAKSENGSEQNEFVTHYFHRTLFPLHQVTEPKSAVLKLISVLINAADNYKLVKYDESIQIDPPLAEAILSRWLSDFKNAKPGEEPDHINNNGFVQSLNNICEAQGKDTQQIMKMLLKQVYAYATFTDHLGLCCPACKSSDSEDQNQNTCPPLPKLKVSNVSLAEHEVHDALPKFDCNGSYTQQNILANVQNDLKVSLVSISKKINDFELDGLENYFNQLNRYPANPAFKVAMMMKYVIGIIDILDVYRESQAPQKKILNTLFTPERDYLCSILNKLTVTLVNDSQIPSDDERKEILKNRQQSVLQQTNYKSRFSIAATLDAAIGILGDKLSASSDKVREIFNSAKLNLEIEDEKDYLQRYRQLNSKPSIPQMDVEISLGKRLGDFLHPIALNIVAGKKGSGKSEAVKNSFDDENFKEIDKRRVFRFDNVEKSSSSFDVKGSNPQQTILLTINNQKGLSGKTPVEELETIGLEKNTFDDVNQHEKDNPDATKLTGCPCCSERDQTINAIDAVDRGAKGSDAKTILLDTVGIADFKGLATVSHEVMGRVFPSHLSTVVNLNNPDWVEILKATREIEQKNDQSKRIVDQLDEWFKGKSKNILAQTLMHATDVLVNNYGFKDRPAISIEEFNYLLKTICGQNRVPRITVTDVTKQKNPQIKNKFSGFRDQPMFSLDDIPQEVNVFEGELAEDMEECDLSFKEFKHNHNKKKLYNMLLRMWKDGLIERAKGHFYVLNEWFELQITDAKFIVKQLNPTPQGGDPKQILETSLATDCCSNKNSCRSFMDLEQLKLAQECKA